MATGLDGLLFTLTTTLIVARILAFPTQIDLPDNEYMVEDLGLYSGTKPKPSCYDFSLDLLYPRIVSEKIRHYTNRRYYKYLPNQNRTTYTSIIRILFKKELLKIGKIQFAQYQLSDDVDKR
jgi:hypothetical protein